MDFDLTDEQRMLAEIVGDLLEKRYDSNSRLQLLRSDLGWSRELWQQYAALGLLGLPFDERYGGAGMGPAEVAVVMEQFGRSLVLEPYFPTVVLGGGLVAAAGSADQKAALLPGVASGELLLALAVAEQSARWSLTNVGTTASPSPRCWTITGQKIAVVGGDSADHVVVTARMPDGEVGLFVVDVAAADATLRRQRYRMQDGLAGADLLFEAAPAEPLGSPAEAAMTLDAVVTTALAMLCAEAVGAMDRMLWLTVDYVKTRTQFGHPIAEFQAVQHRAADMYVAVEEARSMALLARLALDLDDVDEQRRAVQAARIKIDSTARHVGQEAIQLHGGIGMTAEYPVGHYVKRTTVISRTLADTDSLLEAVAAGGGLVRP